MLLRFRVANHRSIRDEAELTLVAADSVDSSDSIARDSGIAQDGGGHVPVLPVAGIFGANASGKSNMLSAFHAMREAVRTSFADWAKYPGVPNRQPFKLDAAGAEETTLFEVDLVLGARTPVRYTYGFELSDDRVEAEWLHAYPGGIREVWFDREADRPAEDGDEYLFESPAFTGRRDDLVALTRPNALFLSTAATLNDPQLSALHRWFLNNLWLMTPGEDITHRADWTKRRLTELHDDTGYRERLVQLLAAEVVRLFQDRKANAKGAQLIFTTHDATLLGNAVLDRPLGRDQVWLTAKTKSGATELYPLVAAHPEAGEDLERGYLRGRYGGVPRVTPGEIAREVSWLEEKAAATA